MGRRSLRRTSLYIHQPTGADGIRENRSMRPSLPDWIPALR